MKRLNELIVRQVHNGCFCERVVYYGLAEKSGDGYLGVNKILIRGDLKFILIISDVWANLIQTCERFLLDLV